MKEKRSKNAKGGSISRTIFKTIGLFSGLESFNILCSIIKMKLVALWLHASGVGLFGIYNSTIETISTFTNMGLRQSAIRDIAMNCNNENRLAIVVRVVRRWSRFAGLFGAIVISGIAPLLGEFFFDDWTNCWGFIVLSASMLLNAIINGEQAVLQGNNMLKSLAKGSFFGSLFGLIFSIPMFWYWREDAVVASIVAYSITVLSCTLFFRFKTPKASSRITLKETFEQGKGFVKLGIYMATATFITNIAHLIFLAYLNNAASTSEVGFYQAGTTLIIKYVGLIFTAIGMELYPRLAANHRSPNRIRLFVSHEISLLLLVVTPIILLFLLCREWIVELLYSAEFIVIVPFISWAIMCSIFKAISWCMAYTIVAKGDGKTYMLTEGIDAIIGLALNIVLYNCFGLVGIGIAYILWYFIYCLIIGFVYTKRYRLSLSKQCIQNIVLTIVVCGCGLAAIELLPIWLCAIIFAMTILLYTLQIKHLYTSKH